MSRRSDTREITHNQHAVMAVANLGNREASGAAFCVAQLNRQAGVAEYGFFLGIHHA